MVTDKQCERIEKEQDLRTQESTLRSNHSLIEQSERKLAQIGADYRFLPIAARDATQAPFAFPVGCHDVDARGFPLRRYCFP